MGCHLFFIILFIIGEVYSFNINHNLLKINSLVFLTNYCSFALIFYGCSHIINSKMSKVKKLKTIGDIKEIMK